MPRSIESGTPENMVDQLKKATAEIIVLSSLKKQPMYTYEIAQRIEQISEGKIVFHTLYRAIYRLQNHGYIFEESKELSDMNRVRIYFSITRSGLEYLDTMIKAYREYTTALETFIEN